MRKLLDPKINNNNSIYLFEIMFALDGTKSFLRSWSHERVFLNKKIWLKYRQNSVFPLFHFTSFGIRFPSTWRLGQFFWRAAGYENHTISDVGDRNRIFFTFLTKSTKFGATTKRARGPKKSWDLRFCPGNGPRFTISRLENFRPEQSRGSGRGPGFPNFLGIRREMSGLAWLFHIVWRYLRVTFRPRIKHSIRSQG